MNKMYIRSYFLWFIGLVATYFFTLFVYMQVPESFRYATNIKSTTGGYGHSLLRFNEIEDVDEVDILFLGSSHTYRGFDPRVFAQEGISSFNLGSSAQTPLNTYYLLSRYIDDIDIKLIVMDTYWEVSANPDGKEATIDLSSNMKVSLENLQMAIASKNVEALNSVAYNWLQQRLAPQALSLDKQKYYENNEYIAGGYVESTRELDKEKTLSRLSEKSVELADIQLSSIKKIVELALSKDIKIILIRTPVASESLEKISNYSDTQNPIIELSEKYNIAFIDYNDKIHSEDIGLTLDKHYYDSNHLNYLGVEKFNKYIAPRLVDTLAEI